MERWKEECNSRNLLGVVDVDWGHWWVQAQDLSINSMMKEASSSRIEKVRVAYGWTTVASGLELEVVAVKVEVLLTYKWAETKLLQVAWLWL